EWIIRQYDHEVQSTSCLKPLVGVHASGPGDAAVHAPVLGSTKGFALGLGINPRFADLDPHAASMAAIDEALRNVVAVGGDPERTCILDNFSWGNTQKSDRLGALVLAAEGCRDASLALGLPFVSGKDSLNNEYATSDGTICIPHTLLVTALALVDDVRQSVSMDLKQEGSLLFLIGSTADERGGSSWARAHGRLGSRVPAFDAQRALAHHRAVHAAIRRGLVRSCHDLSEGGLAVAAAEMAFSGGLGSRIELSKMILRDPTVDDAGRLFSESLTRWLVEVAPADHAAFSTLMAGVDCALIGEVIAGPRLEIRGHDGDTVIDEDIDALRRIFETGLSSMLEGERRG
ncbi:MAG: phosphoribosylformylglycinamidine synthase, partial [Planctomycetes bacterium]|nr:phosphoribosylformylglycinamidine synthase [Planctomycetota bacterium]